VIQTLAVVAIYHSHQYHHHHEINEELHVLCLVIFKLTMVNTVS
jgi:hypothetical protein